MEFLHVDLVYRRTGLGVDGIWDHGELLARALADVDGVTASVHDLRTPEAGRDLVGLASNAPPGRHVVVLQYQGFSYGRWGWAPWLIRALWHLHSSRPDTTIVLLAHELYVELDGPRNVALGIPQRAQFAALRELSDVVLTTTEAFAKRAGGVGRPSAGVLPVGSNLPDCRSGRLQARRLLRVQNDQLVVGLLGTGHWTRMFDVLAATVDRLSANHPLVILNLGAGAPPLRVGRKDTMVYTPGKLEVSELARRLSAVDLLLLPFVDGASTRRTTLMAGLQHAVPVLSTHGPSTGNLLRTAPGLALVPVGAVHEEFATRASALLEDRQLRERVAEDGRDLYDRNFAWPVIAGRLLDYVKRAATRR